MESDSSLKTAKILTANKLPDRFLDTKVYEPASPEESVFGNTYLLIEITTPWFPTAKITKLIRSTFLEEYYQSSLNTKEAKRFEDGLKAVNRKLSELAGAGQTEWIGNLNAIIATISDKKLYLSHTGTAEAYLFRRSKISHITEGEEMPKNPSPIQTFSALINGELELEDKLVLSNAEMYNFVSIDTLRNAVAQISPNVAAEEVAEILLREKADKINAIFINLEAINQTQVAANSVLPDTIFLGAEEEKKFKFNPAKSLGTAKKSVTGLGFIVLKSGTFFARLLSRKKIKDNQPEDLTAKDKLKSADLSYLTSSIDVNLSHRRDRGKYNKSKFSVLFEVVSSLWLWLKNINRKWLYGLIALLIILAVAGGIYYRFKSSKTTQANDFSSIISASQQKIDSADTQAAVHNEAEAKRLLLEAQSSLESIKDKPKSPVEVILLLDKISQKLDSLNKIVRFDTPKELASLGSLATKMESGELIYLGGTLYALNFDGQEIMAVITDKGDKEVIAKLPEEAGTAKNMSYFENERQLIIESVKNRLFVYSLKTNKLEEIKNDAETTFPEADSITTYLTNVYFLSLGENKMTKYTPSGSGYDKGRDVYKGLVDLKDVSSFAIDGNIYLLHQNGSLERTLNGKTDLSFTLKNIPEPNSTLDQPNQVVAGADINSIYILEAKKHRLLEFNKNGEYLRQFVFKESIGELNNFTLNEKAKKLYLLSNNKIFEIDL